MDSSIYVYCSSVVLILVLFLYVRERVIKYADYWLLWASGFLFLSIFFLLRFDNYDRNVVADRFMYLPGTGICVWLGVIFDRAIIKYGRWVAILLSILFLYLGFCTFNYALIWKDSESFWTQIINSSNDEKNILQDRSTVDNLTGNKSDDGFESTKVLAFFNRGCFYESKGEELLKQHLDESANEFYNKAMQDLNRAIELSPMFSKAYHRRAFIWMFFNNKTAALNDFSSAIRHDPDLQEAYIDRCSLYGSLDQIDSAFTDCKHALSLGAKNPELFNNMGLIYAQKGEPEFAVQSFNSALQIDPSYYVARSNKELICKKLSTYHQSQLCQ